MKRFGTIYPFVESREPSLRMGRLVANFEFLTGLLAHGDFEQHHFFSPDIGLQQTLKQRLETLGLDEGLRSGITQLLYFDLKNALAKAQYDIFHLGGFGHFMPGLAYLRNNHASKPFPITGVIHSLNGFESIHHFLKLGKAPFQPYDALICTSSAGKKVVSNYLDQVEKDFGVRFGGRLEHIPLGIRDEHFQPGDRAKARAKLGWDSEKPYLLTIGRFSPTVKVDHGPLFACLQRMVSVGNRPFKVILAGGRDIGLPLVESMIEEYGLQDVVETVVDFDDNTKPLLYDAADIFFSLSDNYQETFGLSVVEAMAHQLPCVVSDFNGYKDLVEEGKQGFRIRTIAMPGCEALTDITEVMRFGTAQLLHSQAIVVDLEQLQTRFQALLQSPALRSQMGEAAHQKASLTYKWSAVIRQYQELWQQLGQDAQKQTRPNTRIRNPFEIDYLSVFQDYCSSRQTPDTLFEITPEGKAVLTGSPLPGKYTDVHSLLVDEVIVLLLRLLDETSGTEAQIFTVLAEKNIGLDASLLRLHLMWMAKYGLLRIK